MPQPIPRALCRQAYRARMLELWVLFHTPTITPAQIRVYWKALSWLDQAVFEAAIDQVVLRETRFPTPATILECAKLCVPHPPTKEQAWLELFLAWEEEVQRSTTQFRPGDWLDSNWDAPLTRVVLRELGGMWANDQRIHWYKVRFDQVYQEQYDLELARRMAGQHPLALPERGAQDDERGTGTRP